MDKLLKATSTKFAVIFFAIVMLSLVAPIWSWGQDHDPWMIGDWLTSYADGFHRRGLFGAIAAGASDTIGVPIVSVVMAFHFAFYLVAIIGAALLVAGRALNFWFVLLLVSPVAFFFPLLGTLGGGRKEIVHFALLAVWLLYLQHRRPGWVGISIFAALAAMATLGHELVLFFSPFYVAAMALQAERRGERLDLAKAAAIPLAVGVTAAFVFVFGGAPLSGICNDLLTRGLPEQVCTGALTWPAGFRTNLEIVRERVVTLNYGAFYPLLLAVAFLPVIGHVIYSRLKSPRRSSLWKWTLACFAAVLPLYVIALDWGRWAHIYVVSFALLAAADLESESETSPKVNWVIAAPLAALFMASWSIPHCCAPTISRSVIGAVTAAAAR